MNVSLYKIKRFTFILIYNLHFNLRPLALNFHSCVAVKVKFVISYPPFAPLKTEEERVGKFFFFKKGKRWKNFPEKCIF